MHARDEAYERTDKKRLEVAACPSTYPQRCKKQPLIVHPSVRNSVVVVSIAACSREESFAPREPRHALL